MMYALKQFKYDTFNFFLILIFFFFVKFNVQFYFQLLHRQIKGIITVILSHMLAINIVFEAYNFHTILS